MSYSEKKEGIIMGKGSDIEKCVKAGKWDKIEKKYLGSSDENRLELAIALGTTSADEGYNALINLIKDENPKVQLEAVKSLGLISGERAVGQLQWLLSKTPATNKELQDAINTSVTQIKAR